jgi:hypothetical protein
VKLSSWPEIGPDGDVLLMPYVPKGITGYMMITHVIQIIIQSVTLKVENITSILHHIYNHRVTLFYPTTCITISLRTFHTMTDEVLSAISFSVSWSSYKLSNNRLLPTMLQEALL